jgi:TolB-like protein
VRDQVLDKLNFTFEELGPQKVKNIARPVEAFRVDLGVSALSRKHFHKLAWQRLARSRQYMWTGVALVLLVVAGIAFWSIMHRGDAAPDTNSQAATVAVLPFMAADSSLEAQRIADTITRDLISMLSKESSLYRVVSQTSTATYRGRTIDPRAIGRDLGALYLVQGEVRRAGQSTEVSLQLLETAAATQIWRDSVEVKETGHTSNNLVVLLDGRIRRGLFAANMRRFSGPPTSKAGPLELTMHGWSVWSHNNNTVQGAREARKWFDRALSVDPNFVLAMMSRFRTLYYELDFDPHVDKRRVLKEMDDLSFRAVNIDSDSANTWFARASSLIRAERWDAALEANAKAEKVAWPDAATVIQRAEIMVFTGRPEEALALADRALEMDPTDKEEMGWVMLQRCRAFMALARYDEAADACERNIALDSWWLPHLYLVAAYALKEQTARAAAEKATLLDLRPPASIADFARYAYSDTPEVNVLRGLRKAGLAEQ